MKLSSLQAASASSPSPALKVTRIQQSETASQVACTGAAVEGDAQLRNADDTSVGIETCGWYESMPLRAGASGSGSRYWSSCPNILQCPSVANAYDARSTDASSPACLSLSLPTSPGTPETSVLTIVDWSVPISQAGADIIATASSPQTPTISSPQHSNSSSPLLKPPAGTILEAILGAIVIAVLVIISCVIIARKVHLARTVALRADTSRSSLTVSALPAQEGREPDIPLSTRREAVRAGRESKIDRPRGGDGRCGSDTAEQ